MRIRRIKQVVIDGLAIFLISCLLLEITLRIYNHISPSYLFYSDSYNRFRGKPFAKDWDFRLNSRGFKDVEFSENKDPGVIRIVGIGDSFAFGVVPYKYNYHTLLGSFFKERGRKIEVLNMGIPDLGPNDYLSLLLKEGLDLKPDMVLLSFFVGNDFLQSDRYYVRNIPSYSYVASLINFLVNIYIPQGRIYHGGSEYCDNCPSFDQETYLRIAHRDGTKSSIFIKGNRQFVRWLNDAVSYMSQINDVCKNHGIDLVIVLIPDELQINEPLQNDIRQTFYNDSQVSDWDYTYPNVIFSRKLKDLGIDSLDLLPFFLAESKSKTLYKPRDSHWNIAGNELAAQTIRDYLVQHKPSYFQRTLN